MHFKGQVCLFFLSGNENESADRYRAYDVGGGENDTRDRSGRHIAALFGNVVNDGVSTYAGLHILAVLLRYVAKGMTCFILLASASAFIPVRGRSVSICTCISMCAKLSVLRTADVTNRLFRTACASSGMSGGSSDS